jgi:hypothetical protein
MPELRQSGLLASRLALKEPPRRGCLDARALPLASSISATCSIRKKAHPVVTMRDNPRASKRHIETMQYRQKGGK